MMEKEHTLEITNKNLFIIHACLSAFDWHYGRKLSPRVLSKIRYIYKTRSSLGNELAFRETVYLNIHDLGFFRTAMKTYYQTNIEPMMYEIFTANNISSHNYRVLKSGLKNHHQMMLDTIFQLLIDN